MVANHIINASVLHHAAPSSAGRSRGAMVRHVKIKEALAPPSQHIGFNFINCVPSGSNPQTANGVPTGTAINLHGAPHMKAWMPFQNQAAIFTSVIQHSTAYTDCGLAF